MKVTPIKTPTVQAGDDLFEIIKQSVKTLPEKSVLVVTSKIVALAEGAVIKKVAGTKHEKHELVKKDAQYYIDPSNSKYSLMLTIKDYVLAVNAGIDESNAGENYVKFPEDSYKSAEKIWHFLRTEYGVKKVGVLITDSKTFPLKWGIIGTFIAYCGFKPLNDRRGAKDLFGYTMQMTQVNVAEALSVAAVLEMGETNESQPLCLIEDAKMVKFQNRPPTQIEIKYMQIPMEDDAYAPVLINAPWKKGGKG